MFHNRSKNIQIRSYYILDMVQRGGLRLHHISINEKVDKIITKPLLKGELLVFKE